MPGIRQLRARYNSEFLEPDPKRRFDPARVETIILRVPQLTLCNRVAAIAEVPSINANLPSARAQARARLQGRISGHDRAVALIEVATAHVSRHEAAKDALCRGVHDPAAEEMTRRHFEALSRKLRRYADKRNRA